MSLPKEIKRKLQVKGVALLNILFAFIMSFILIVIFTIAGVRMWRRNWKLLALLCAIPLILVLVISSFVYDLFYTSTPDSLEIQATQNNQQVNVSWVWKNKLEKYSYGKDYIAISLPKSTKISNTNLKSFEIAKVEDRNLLGDLRSLLERDPNYDSLKELYLFEVKLQKNFQAFFETTPEIA
jgi:hypothetical protein